MRGRQVPKPISNAHKQRMIERRARQLARTAGFTPIPNLRIARAIHIRALGYVESGVDPLAAEKLARNAVFAKLPASGFTRNTLRAPRPSKSDDPAWRKLNPARAMARC